MLTNILLGKRQRSRCRRHLLPTRAFSSDSGGSLYSTFELTNMVSTIGTGSSGAVICPVNYDCIPLNEWLLHYNLTSFHNMVNGS